ncbi:MAG: hypothetical protein ACI3YH_07510 [Eubacteriales bacterium]
MIKLRRSHGMDLELSKPNQNKSGGKNLPPFTKVLEVQEPFLKKGSCRGWEQGYTQLRGNALIQINSLTSTCGSAL